MKCKVITDEMDLRQMDWPQNFPGIVMLGELNQLLYQDCTMTLHMNLY